MHFPAGYNPLNPFDSLTTKDLDNLSQDDFTLRQIVNLRECHDAIRLTATINAVLQPTKEPREYRVGDQVLILRVVTRDPNEATRPKMKWKPTYVGPFTVAEKISKHAYRIDFPSDIRVHPVVNVATMKPFVPNDDHEFPHRHVDAPGPVRTEDGDEWVVTEILDHKNATRCPYFLARYEGYPVHRDKWCRWDWLFSLDFSEINDALLRYIHAHPEAAHRRLRQVLRDFHDLDLPDLE